MIRRKASILQKPRSPGQLRPRPWRSATEFPCKHFTRQRGPVRSRAERRIDQPLGEAQTLQIRANSQRTLASACVGSDVVGRIARIIDGALVDELRHDGRDGRGVEPLRGKAFTKLGAREIAPGQQRHRGAVCRIRIARVLRVRRILVAATRHAVQNCAGIRSPPKASEARSGEGGSGGGGRLRRCLPDRRCAVASRAGVWRGPAPRSPARHPCAAAGTCARCPCLGRCARRGSCTRHPTSR